MKTFQMKDEYFNNLGVMSKEDLETLSQKRVLLVGAGGLGGHVANSLIRLGVMHLMIVDFDVYDFSNLNRQLFASQDTIGMYKADIVAAALRRIISDASIESKIARIEDIPSNLIKEYDIIIDAVDNIDSKKYIAKIAGELNKPLLHGACGGWYGQVGLILPGNKLIFDLYDKEEGLEEKLKNPSFNPAVIANIMVSEFLKFIQKDKQATINQLLLVDLYNNTMIKTGE